MKEGNQNPAQSSKEIPSEGGISMMPPAHGPTAAPLQAKMAGQGPIQMKVNGRSEEQERLRQEFQAYCELKSAQITDQGQKMAFQKKAQDFIAWADEKSGWFDKDQKWGNGDYKKRLKRDFSDYQQVISGEVARIKASTLQDAQAALEISKAAVATAKAAMEQAQQNVEAAKIAAAQADASAKEAEDAATVAEANALLPDAGEPEKQAAVKAREAATAARAAADAAQKAVEAAEGNSQMALYQNDMAVTRMKYAETLIERSNDITQLEAAKRQQKGVTSFKDSSATFSSAITDNLAKSDQAKTSAETAAGEAKTAAGEAEKQKMLSVPIPGLNDKIKELGAAGNEKDRKAKAKELMALARAEIAKMPAKVTSYKDQPNPTPDEKIRVIGEMAIRAARIEWLLGTIYLQGSDDKNKWKGGKLTKDEEKLLGNYYEGTVGAASSSVWCTAFLGTIFMTVAGLKTAKGKNPNSGQLWSGYKVGKHGKDAIFDFSEDQGGKHVGRSEAKKDESWVELHKSIKAEKDQTKREEIVAQFFKDHFTPQAGDQMIVKRSTNPNPNSFAEAKSHTTIVEKVVGTKIYTIEGNAGNRVQGRVYDLATAEDSAKIVFISRFSLNNFGDKPDPTKVWTGPEITEAELLGPLDKLSSTLQAFAQEKAYIRTLGEGEEDVVSNLKQGGGKAGAGE